MGNEDFAYHKMVLTDYSCCQFYFSFDINNYFIVNQKILNQKKTLSTKNLVMKIKLKPGLLMLFVIATLFAFTPRKHRLPGKWTIYNADGTSSGEYVELKSDGIYNVYLPGGHIGETGFYKLKRHVFSIRNAKDYVCGGGYWGKYKLQFYGDDSIHLEVIEDSCTARRMDIVGYNPGLRRMKAQ